MPAASRPRFSIASLTLSDQKAALSRFPWVELPEGISAEELFERAIRERVAFVPALHFSPPPRAEISCA
jgi:DNA-binding transcriptional MocR family regulator